MRKTLRQKNEQNLEEQLAFLRWRRMQNERQIRRSLETTKSLAQKDELMRVSMDQGSEKSMWMESVIRDELSRPLVITDEVSFLLSMLLSVVHLPLFCCVLVLSVLDLISEKLGIVLLHDHHTNISHHYIL